MLKTENVTVVIEIKKHIITKYDKGERPIR